MTTCLVDVLLIACEGEGSMVLGQIIVDNVSLHNLLWAINHVMKLNGCNDNQEQDNNACKCGAFIGLVNLVEIVWEGNLLTKHIQQLESGLELLAWSENLESPVSNLSHKPCFYVFLILLLFYNDLLLFLTPLVLWVCDTFPHRPFVGLLLFHWLFEIPA